jgi:hypothetical protein
VLWEAAEAVTATGIDLGVFAKNGVLGVSVLCLGVFAYRAYNREAQRADRLETALLEKVIPVIEAATQAVKDANEERRDQERDRRGR